MKEILQDVLAVEEYFLGKTPIESKVFKSVAPHFWMQSTPWPLGVAKSLREFRDFDVLPFSYIPMKIFARQLLKGQFASEHFKNAFLGELAVWPFMPIFRCAVRADVVIDNGTRILLFYREVATPFVIKKFENFVNYSNEKRAMETALQVAHEVVRVPTILGYEDEKIYALQQEWVLGFRSLRHCPVGIHEGIYDQVVDFMGAFFAKANVRAEPTSSMSMEKYRAIKEYLDLQDCGKYLTPFIELLSENKRVFWGIKHGDLNVDNILVRADDGMIYLIDWGEGFEGLVVTDLTKGGSRGLAVFDELVAASGYDASEIHTFEEQVYIDLCMKFINRVYKRYARVGLSCELFANERRFLQLLPTLR